MNTNRRPLRAPWVGLVASLGFLMPVVLPAHHALDAEFDTKKPISLTGLVTKIDWTNPHVRLYLNVKDQDKAGSWELDMGSPNVQMMNGWKIDTYRPGDQVTVVAYPARNGAMVAYGSKISRR